MNDSEKLGFTELGNRYLCYLVPWLKSLYVILASQLHLTAEESEDSDQPADRHLQ